VELLKQVKFALSLFWSEISAEGGVVENVDWENAALP
jgi:hypothetical protein